MNTATITNDNDSFTTVMINEMIKTSGKVSLINLILDTSGKNQVLVTRCHTHDCL